MTCVRHVNMDVFLDLDDTTFDLKSTIIPFNNEFFGIEISPEEYAGNWMNTPWGARYKTREEYNHMIDNVWWPHALSSHLYENLTAMPYAEQELYELQELGVRFSSISSRPAKIEAATMICIKRELARIKLNRTIFLGEFGHASTKGEIVHGLGGRALVDDIYLQAESAMKYNIPCVLFGDALDVAEIIADETKGLYRSRNWLEVGRDLRRILQIG